MAKIANCVFCNKEVTKGFFNGNSQSLEVGSSSLICCTDCYNKYKMASKARKRRFALKFETLKKTTRKRYTEKEIAKMYLTYIEEEEKQKAKCGDEVADMFQSFYNYNFNGYFSVREFGKGFLNEDRFADEMIKSLDKASETDCCCFDKNDITKIEYARVGNGDIVDMFHKAYSFAIRLNDEKIMTYKPCITRTATVGKGFFAFGYKKSAEKVLIEELNEFKRIIGSDLPIVKVGKI